MPDLVPEKHKESVQFITKILESMQQILIDLDKEGFAAKWISNQSDMSTRDLIFHDEIFKRGYKERIIYDTIGEFINFTDSSLLAARVRKHSVSYALLRKPFRDIVDVWIFLIIDADYYVENLFDNPQKIDVAKGKVREYLSSRINDTDELKERDFNEEHYRKFLSLRYSVSEDLTLSKMMTQANHLLTTTNGQKSDEGTLNFIHFTKVHDKTLWEVYFSQLKLLLLYMSHVLIILIEKYTTGFASSGLEKLYELTWKIE